MFVDHVRIFAKAGDGGSGSSSFRRESFVPKGGPDGGDGGHGASVILRADPHTDSLISLFFEPQIRAPDGGRGQGKKKYGKSMEPKVVLIPVGTRIYRLPPGQTITRRAPVEPEDASEHAKAPLPPDTFEEGELELLADLTEVGHEYALCQGGRGGRGNVHFKSSRNQAPTRADPGEAGTEGFFYLELRKIADAGFVGYPNAGKSTLLTCLSAARPKVAPYPFTTLHPIVGVMEFPDTYERVTLADIPGLIEGAHRNVGLGHEFLRHITRCRLLVFVLDMAGSEGRHPLEDLASLRKELSLYDRHLSDVPWLVAANKMDLPEAAEYLRVFQARHPKLEVLPISASTQAGLDALRSALRHKLAGLPVPVQTPADAPS